MNDDFLHRIRVEPPPEFLARLKSRLDLQPPPTTPAPVTLRRLALGLLLTGSVFAITFMILSRGMPEQPRGADKKPTAEETPHGVRSEPKVSEPAARGSTATTSKPAPDVKPNTPSPITFTYVTTKALEPYLTDQLSKAGNHTIVAPNSSADAIAEFCRTTPTNKIEVLSPLMALVTQRMTPSELDRCSHNVGNVKETPMGHQVVALARSSLYGTISLTPADLFLALSAEIPDPNQPDKLIPNPNTMWTDVNLTLEREPIEFFGPEPSSPVGMAFREILFEAGCRAVPGMAAVKQCPPLRQDGVYTVVEPSDLLLKLQTKPNAMGIMPFSFAYRNTNELAISPLQGVAPTMETIANDTYPGARPLFLYSHQLPWFLSNPFANSYQNGRFAIIPPERSQP